MLENPVESHPPRFGIVLFTDSFGRDVDSATVLAWALDYASHAQRHGWDEIWTTEHHFTPHAQNPSAVAMAAFLLGRTGLRVGTAVSVLPNHHPVALAEQASLLAHLSGDRFTLGVGRGQPLVDLDVLGTGLAGHRDPGEAVALLAEALRHGRAHGRGERFRFPDVPIVPTPPPRRAPFVLSAASSASVRLAARHGLPVLLGPLVALEDKRALLAEHAALAAEHGHPIRPSDNIDSAYLAVADDTASARRRLTEGLADFTVRTARAARSLVPARPPSRQEADESVARLADRHVAGTPAECRAQLRARLDALGVGTVLLMPEAGSPEATISTIRRAGDEVIGRLDAA